MRHVTRQGRYWRVADPNWSDPFSPEYARKRGGRWNPPGAFGVVYLNASRPGARAQVLQKLEPRGIHPEDLDPTAGPALVGAEIPSDRYVDAVTDAGLRALGLPTSYPLDAGGRTVSHSACQPIGQRVHEANEPGVACRSAARAAPPGGEELAYFGGAKLRALQVEPFADWFWGE